MEEHHMSEPEPAKISKPRTKHTPAPSLLAGLLLAMQRHLDPDKLSEVLEDATRLMHEFRVGQSKRSPNE